MTLFNTAAELDSKNVPFAYCSVIESKGSAPRHHANMIVMSNGEIVGTIGGGPVEYTVIQQAVEAIKLRHSCVIECVLNKNEANGLNMNCGGTVKVFIEVHQKRPILLLMGGGHVNQQVGLLANQIGFDVKVLDDKVKDVLKEAFPYASYINGNLPFQTLIENVTIDQWEDCYIVIATKDNDQVALESVLKFNPKYIGVIASKRKSLIIRENISAREDAISQNLSNRTVQMPIGINLGGETPMEIAISIIAQIQMCRYNRDGESLNLGLQQECDYV